MAQWQLSAGVPLIGYVLKEVPKWQGAVAVGAVSVPAYEGSNHSRVIPIAAAELRYRDIAYFSSSEGLGVNVLHGKSYRVGLALGYDIGRAERRDARLKGLGDIDSSPELKMYAEKVFFPVVLRSTVLHTLAGDAGWSADVAAYLPLAGSKNFLVLAGPAVTVSNRRELRRRFGVSAEQSANSGLPQYRPNAGLRNASLGFSATWFIDSAWFINATGSVQRLLGPAADSPLIERETQQALIVIAGYRW